LFSTYVRRLGEVANADKLSLLVNHVDAVVYELITEATAYDDAGNTLQGVYAKPPNPIFVRYLLKSCKQQHEETLDQHVQKLRRLSTNCNFLALSASQHKEEAISDVSLVALYPMESDSDYWKKIISHLITRSLKLGPQKLRAGMLNYLALVSLKVLHSTNCCCPFISGERQL